MIDYLIGTTHKIYDKSLTVLAHGVGFLVAVPNTQNFKLNEPTELFTYLHWSQDNGPKLFGFASELERTIFLMIIDCPKIGPSIALTILSQIPPHQFIQVITAQNTSALSALNGIGEKKAEQLVMQLKYKVEKLIAAGSIEPATHDTGFTHMQQLTDVLISLNYSKPEVSGALRYVSENYVNKDATLDQLIRAALGYLAKAKVSMGFVEK